MSPFPRPFTLTSPTSSKTNNAEFAIFRRKSRLVWILLFAGLCIIVTTHLTSTSGLSRSDEAYVSREKVKGDAPPIRLSRMQKAQSLYGLGDYHDRRWLGHIEQLDDEGLAPATKSAQRFLHEWQNPTLDECYNKLFYRIHLGDVNSERHGLGSAIHFVSQSMQIALQTNRILAWGFPDTFGAVFVDPNCNPGGSPSLDCIYEPLTSCPQYVMNSTNTVDIGLYDVVDSFPLEMSDWKAPPVFTRMLHKFLGYTLAEHAMKYWYRGQVAAYVMRLNKASQEYIAALRLDKTRHSAISVYRGANDDHRQVEEPFPFPLPPSTVSLHVRHGDKGSEMTLHPLTTYVQRAEMLAAQNPFAVSRFAFVSSEDPEVIEEAHKIPDLSPGATTTPKTYWTWFTSELGRINSSPFEQLNTFGNKTEITLGWMSELMLALECDAFIGTRGSNWNRIIDELRCIWLDKCRHTYVEVGPLKDWHEYSW